MSKNMTIVIVVVLVLLVGGYLLLKSSSKNVSQNPVVTQTPAAPASVEASTSASPQSQQNLVDITASGFSPQNITIKAGQAVTWKNTDTADHNVNSAVHPTHLVYPPLNLGLIKPGETKSLTFPTAGTYKYHDHLNPSLTGSVTVQ